MKIPVKRVGAAAAACSGVAAGTIDSSSGSATVAPIPRRNVRRGRRRFAMNILSLPQPVKPSP